MAEFGNLYLIRIYNDNEDFFKIGTSVHKYCRFHPIIKLGYKVEIVLMLLGIDFITSLNQERLLQNVFQSNYYFPKIKFGGYTECFLHIDISQYKKIASKVYYKSCIENFNINYQY